MVGLVIEICGAVILANGLFLSPRQVAGMVEQFPGPDLSEAMERCENRADAEIGVRYLVAGFVLQFIGYGAELAGVVQTTGGIRLGVIAAFSVGSGAIALLAWRPLKDRRARSLMAVVETDLERRAAERGES
ncbi:MAG: hypothetical protein JSU06_03915 [Actinobacteria bacterium]|nr:hypothetical protein [Actinomycetota bacterium]